jgi:hypothetical protein
MISLKSLVDMVCTEAVENRGVPDEHHFDETRDPHASARNLQKLSPPYVAPGARPADDLPPIQFDLELMRREDGSLYWIE